MGRFLFEVFDRGIALFLDYVLDVGLPEIYLPGGASTPGQPRCAAQAKNMPTILETRELPYSTMP
jgi:hypothetical protein